MPLPIEPLKNTLQNQTGTIQKQDMAYRQAGPGSEKPCNGWAYIARLLGEVPLPITIELIPAIASAVFTVVGLALVFLACKASGSGPPRDTKKAEQVIATVPYELLDLVFDPVSPLPNTASKKPSSSPNSSITKSRNQT